jgi:hypothetical protein
MRTLTLFILFAVLSFGAPIFTDNFDSSLPGSILNAAVPGWNTTNGAVDYIKSGGYGITCRGGIGGCIDLDGSIGNAGDFESAATLNLLAGNVYTLTYYFSGNQRSGSADSMTVTFGGSSNTHTNIASNAPFAGFTIVVAPAANTTSKILFSHAGGDNIGLILDDVTVDVRSVGGAVPEPTSLLLLGTGLAALAASRLRRSA